MNRQIQDAGLSITKAMPAQNTNHNSDAIDLGVLNASQLPEGLQLELAVPALPDLADDQTMTFTFQDSADGVTFAAIAELATLVRTGAGGAGAAAATRTVPLPNACRKHVRVNIAASATADDNTAVSATLKLLT